MPQKCIVYDFLSQSCQKSIFSAHMLTKWKYGKLEVLLQAQFYKCSFRYLQMFSPIFVRFIDYLKYITKYLKHSQTIVIIIMEEIIVFQWDYLNLKHLRKPKLEHFKNLQGKKFKNCKNGYQHTKTTQDEEVLWVNACPPIENHHYKDLNTIIHLKNRGPSLKVPLIFRFFIMNFNFGYVYITNCGLKR